MSDEQSVAVAEPVQETVTRKEKRKKQKPKRQPRYHVILWNDEDHTYHYVIRMLKELFGHPDEKGYQLAKEVDSRGRAIVLTTTRNRPSSRPNRSRPTARTTTSGAAKARCGPRSKPRVDRRGRESFCKT